MSDLVGRRAFTQALALASLSAPAILAQNPGQPKSDKPAEKPPEKPPVAEQPEPQRAPVDLWLELVQQAEKRKLEPEQLAAIRRDLERQLVRSRIMSRFPLTNADEPGVHFAAWRAAEPG
jgi:hypothetical protein